MATVRIGISGWRYAPWRKTFYPKGLPQRLELSHAARLFDSIEINGSFYSLQKPEYYRRWHAQTPPGFVFAVKGGRYITHMRRLRDVKSPLANFLASGLLCLNEKLGPILWQFPPNMRFDAERFESFFEMLPADTESAARLAKDHGPEVRGRAWLRIDRNRKMRHAVEIRHESFLTSRFTDLLRRCGIALVVADTAGKFPYAEDLTSDFVYVRLHGDKEIYVSGYTPGAIDHWARRVSAWHQGTQPADAQRIDPGASARPKPRDVFVYFDNDVKVRAPFDALALAERLKSLEARRRGA